VSAPLPFFAAAREWEALRDDLLPRVEAVLASGRVLQGPAVPSFEAELAAWVGRRHAVAVGSGTDALAFALFALGVGPGDEVLVPAFSFIATASCVLRVGARPVFGDVDGDGLLDLEAARSRVGPRTRAVIAVGLYGRLHDPGALDAFGRAHGLAVVEDAAQSLAAASADGRRSGALGEVSCCSFDPTKTLSAPGSGGALLTDDPALAASARALRWHGRDAGGAYASQGFNSQLPSASAEVLSVKLREQERWRAHRAGVAERWAMAAAAGGLVAPSQDPGHAWSKFVVRCAAGERDAVRARLDAAGVPTLVHYATPLHRQPVFASSDPAACPGADRLASEVVSLPLHAMLTRAEVERVEDALTAGGSRARS
jgi:dTDP-4-amino-4,6-dideoxygalactose transaminase